MARFAFAKNFWPALILCAPSIFLLAKIPPLWKDIDAYLQVTAAPDSNTFLQYGPLFCLLARVPLFLCYFYDCARVGLPLPDRTFFAQPVLCDSGVALLIFLQHAAFCIASLAFIARAASKVLARCALALLWASNPVLYVWMHCVGTEGLSVILLLLLATFAFRIIVASPASWRLWIAFGILLTLAQLTRHVNGVVAALLPLAFIFAAIWQRSRQLLLGALLAVMLGLGSIGAAHLSMRAVCAAVGLPYYNRAGFTFLFRQRYLAPLSPEQRSAILQPIDARLSTPEARTVLQALRERPPGSPHTPVMEFLSIVQSRLPDEIAQDDYRLTLALNEVAHAMLLHPSAEYFRAVSHDFLRAQTESLGQVLQHAFLCTTFFLEHREDMPQCNALITYRGQERAHILQPLKDLSYLRLWRRATYPIFLLGCLTSGLFVFLHAKKPASVLLPLAGALVVTGLLTSLATVSVDEYQARFLLPMWLYGLAAFFLLCGEVLSARKIFCSKKSPPGGYAGPVKEPGELPPPA